MAAELVDFRLKVTQETICALAAAARASGDDKPEVARDILHAWAMKQIHSANVLHACLKAKGLDAANLGKRAATDGDRGADGRTPAQDLEWVDE